MAPSARGAEVGLPACDFGPLLNFIGSYLPPSTKTGRSAGVSMAALASAASKPLANASSAPGDAVGIADAYNPTWCAQSRWRVNLVPPGRALVPSNLFVAMMETRKQRLFG